jgi:hypothetical protein
VKLLNIQTGVLEEVAEPNAAIAAGSHAPKRDEVFTFRNPEDGGVYEATGAELRDIISAGGILETPLDRREREIKAKYGHSEILAGTAGVARGLTFGLSDAALSAAGLGEDVKALKEANPYSSMLGEIGGIIVPTLLTGGTGLVAKGAQAATTATRGVAKGAASVAEQIVGKAVGKSVASRTLAGAVEGATYGLGQSISEASLGEPANVAENLLVGGAFGSALPIIGAGLKAAGKFAVEEGLPTLASATSSVPRSELKQFYSLSGAGKKARQLVNVGPKEIKERLVEIARENDDLAKTAGRFFDETKIANAEKMLGNLPPESVAVRTGGFEKLRIAFDDVLATFQSRPNEFAGDIARSVEGIGDDFVKQMSGAKTASDGFLALNELNKRLKAAAKVAGKIQTPQQIAASKATNKLRDGVISLLEDESVWGRPAVMQQKMNSAYTEFEDARKAFSKYFKSQFGEKWRVDANKVLKYARKQGTPEAMDAAEALDLYLSSSNRLRDVIAEFGGPGKLGKMAAEKGEAALRSTLDDMAKLRTFEELGGSTQARLRFGPGFGLPGVGGLLSMINPTGKFAVQVIGAAERALQKTNTEWMKGVGAAVSALSSSVPASLATTVKDLGTAQARGEEILALAGNPTAMAEAVSEATGQLQIAAPKAAAQMQEQMARTVQYLAQKVPGNPTQGMLGAEEWNPSDSELAIWNRHLVAADRPMVLVEDLRAGNLAPETVETVKTLYPNFYSKTVAAVLQSVAEKKIKVSFDKRVQLSILTGQPVESSLRPDTLLALQMSYATAQKPAPPTGNPGKSAIPEANLTPGQRLSSR